MPAVAIIDSLSQSAIHPDVRGCAAMCLPRVKERAAKFQEGQTLLRPLKDETDTDETLLRPAGSSSNGGVGNLLRPLE